MSSLVTLSFDPRTSEHNGPALQNGHHEHRKTESTELNHADACLIIGLPV